MTSRVSAEDPGLEGPPAGMDAATVETAGKLTTTSEIAPKHQRIAESTDPGLEEAIEALRAAGHVELAEQLSTRLLGRNVLPGRWRF